MKNTVTKELIRKYIAGECSEKERVSVESWYIHITSSQALLKKELPNLQAESEIWEALQGRINRKPTFNYWLRGVAAALMVATLAIGIYLYNQSNIQDTIIVPGSVKASIIAADGKTYELSNTEQALASIPINPKIKSNELNTIITPKGGEFYLKLPDGTEVWLNAESELIFPSAFEGDQRIVTLIGEAYFEVAKNANMPFIVNANDSEVEVLGTHFNISCYPEEELARTTLMEGAVKIRKGRSERILTPGQQAIVKNLSSDIAVNHEVDTEKVMAWKEGYFEFKNNSLEDILGQIGRWYRVDIYYSGSLPDKKLTGKIPRESDFSEVLDILSFSGVRYKLTGRKLTIYN